MSSTTQSIRIPMKPGISYHHPTVKMRDHHPEVSTKFCFNVPEDRLWKICGRSISYSNVHLFFRMFPPGESHEKWKEMILVTRQSVRREHTLDSYYNALRKKDVPFAAVAKTPDKRGIIIKNNFTQEKVFFRKLLTVVNGYLFTLEYRTKRVGGEKDCEAFLPQSKRVDEYVTTKGEYSPISSRTLTRSL